MSADRKSNRILVATLKADTRSSINVLNTAAILGSHPNTVYARIERINEMTGLIPRKFSDLNKLLVVADCKGTQ